MRFVPVAVVAVVLLSPPAVSAKSPKRAPKAVVVKVMTESGQALVYDRNRGEYVVVKRGDTFAGYVVSEIDRQQIVLTTPTDPPMHYVLPLVEGAKVGKVARRPPAAEQPPAAGDTPSDVKDPYGESGSESTDVRDPYGGVPSTDVQDPYAADDSSVPTVLAPVGSRVDRTSTPRDSSPKTPKAPSKSVRDPYADAAEPAPTPAKTTTAVRDPYGNSAASKPAKPEKKTGGAEQRTVSRRDFDSALSDFHARSKEVQLTLQKRGIRIDAVAKGSFVARLGIRKGDVILTIAGHKIRNADEAAVVYVELSSANRFDIVLLRNGSKHTIRYTFTE